MKNYSHCPKNIFKGDLRITDGKESKIKFYHWKDCRYCREECNGFIHLKVERKEAAKIKW